MPGARIQERLAYDEQLPDDGRRVLAGLLR